MKALLLAILALTSMALFAPVQAQATTCYGGAISLHYDYHAEPVEYGPYTTTSRCNDINMRLLTNDPRGVFLYACAVFIDHSQICSHGDHIYELVGPQWMTVATDVKDGTHFKLRVGPYDTDAQHVDFQIAF